MRALGAVAIAVSLLVAVAVAASAATYTGAITSGDPSHTNFSNFAGGGPSVCGPTPVYPGLITDSSSYHYDTYSEVNSTGSPVCAAITLEVAAGPGLGAATYAYLGSFDPMNPGTNYAGGANGQVAPGGTVTYHVSVPAGQTLVVEVEEYVAGAGVASYTLTIAMNPTAVRIASASATRTSRGVVVRWRTGQETNLLGFRLERRAAGRTVRVGPRLIHASAGVAGHNYVQLDRTAPRRPLAYRLEAVTRDGTRHVVANIVARA